jgi:hypothetical protein
MLVIAALLMADDVYEMRQRLEEAGSGMPAPAPVADNKLGRRLGKLAKRAEDIAAGLEHP